MEINLVDYNDEYYTVCVSFEGNPNVTFEFSLSDLEVLEEIVSSAKQHIAEIIVKKKQP